MELIKTHLQDCFILKPRIFEDHRGYFFESYNAATFQQLSDLKVQFVQDNQAKSDYGILRGLHFQKGPTHKRAPFPCRNPLPTPQRSPASQTDNHLIAILIRTQNPRQPDSITH